MTKLLYKDLDISNKCEIDKYFFEKYDIFFIF
jgi:hypothetical protein